MYYPIQNSMAPVRNIVLLASAALAVFLPQDASPASTTSSLLPQSHSHSSAAASTTPAPKPRPRQCDYTFCDQDGIIWCYVWDGVTAFDISLGPIPVETRVSLGWCKTKTD